MPSVGISRGGGRERGCGAKASAARCRCGGGGGGEGGHWEVCRMYSVMDCISKEEPSPSAHPSSLNSQHRLLLLSLLSSTPISQKRIQYSLKCCLSQDGSHLINLGWLLWVLWTQMLPVQVIFLVVPVQASTTAHIYTSVDGCCGKNRHDKGDSHVTSFPSIKKTCCTRACMNVGCDVCIVLSLSTLRNKKPVSTLEKIDL